MLNIPEYKEYGGETKIALMDNSSLAFMHELSQRSYPSDGILSVYDLILIPKWVMEEIEDSTYRSTYVEQLQAQGYPIRWIDETKYGAFVNDSVHGIIDDCGYSSALEMINVNCKNRLPSYIPVGVFDFFINIGTKMWGKFSLSETDACDALSKTNIPVLIIHGNADTQAPLYMAYRLYNSCRSEKSLLIVNDAGHAESYSKDPDTYEKTVKEFIQKHL